MNSITHTYCLSWIEQNLFVPLCMHKCSKTVSWGRIGSWNAEITVRAAEIFNYELTADLKMKMIICLSSTSSSSASAVHYALHLFSSLFLRAFSLAVAWITRCYIANRLVNVLNYKNEMLRLKISLQSLKAKDWPSTSSIASDWNPNPENDFKLWKYVRRGKLWLKSP